MSSPISSTFLNAFSYQSTVCDSKASSTSTQHFVTPSRSENFKDWSLICFSSRIFLFTMKIRVNNNTHFLRIRGKIRKLILTEKRDFLLVIFEFWNLGVGGIYLLSHPMNLLVNLKDSFFKRLLHFHHIVK